MKEINKILENRTINSWVCRFNHSPSQINKPHEADAELMEIDGNNSSLLAITIDSVAEEIAEGLYQDPFTMGWVSVMTNFSDLAAVGADPLGIVMAISFDPTKGEKFRGKIAKGIAAACQELGVFVLGGDTNTARNISLTGCAFGFVPRNQRMTRVGCQAGDVVFLSRGAGSGNALGMMRLAKLSEELFPERFYRPVARIKEGQMIRKFATCCMDSSDGLLITLDQLLRVNNKGFIIKADWEKILEANVFRFCQKTGIPYWFMAAGIHGEFELVFTIPQEKVNSFLCTASGIDFHPIRLGIVQEKPSLIFALDSGKKVAIDMAPLRNLWAPGCSDLSYCIQAYHAWGKKWGLE